jgi:hypothetical protein
MGAVKMKKIASAVVVRMRVIGFSFVCEALLLLIRLLYTTIDAVYTMRCNILQEFGNNRRVRFGDALRGLSMRVNNLSSTRTEPQRVRLG